MAALPILLVRYDKHEFPVRLVATDKPGPSTTISVAGPEDIQATVPTGASVSDVRSALEKRVRWIYKKVESFRQQEADVRPRCYVSGESHLYLGRRYMLKLVPDSSDIKPVKLIGGELRVLSDRRDKDAARKALQAWYKQKAREVFERRLEMLSPQVPWVNEPPQITVRSMQKRWGSCTPQGRLLLNWHLVKAPTRCIDYVLLHEMCHLREHNHSEKFYKLLSGIMPDWRQVKARLDESAQKYLNQ